VSLCFLLSTEKASLNSEAILNGFMSKISKENLSYLFAKVQALDIVNCLLKNDNTMLYSQIIEKLSETSFEENKNVCIKVLKNYYENKKSILAKRQNAQELEFGDDFFCLENYEDFINKLEKLCVSSISKEYTTKLPNKIYDLLNIRFLQQRRENKVLVLDNEMLIFLIALFTKSEKTKLTDVYRRFNDYGICFSRNTKLAIESLLLKLNLLDIKSDAGEAQYVRVIL
jgi:DNA phosphorothioation-dependent restriction protein DptG